MRLICMCNLSLIYLCDICSSRWTLSSSTITPEWSVEKIDVSSLTASVWSDQVGHWAGFINSTASLWGANIPILVFTSFSTEVSIFFRNVFVTYHVRSQEAVNTSIILNFANSVMNVSGYVEYLIC
jgi:hypothetical protein